jgi:hypothetical protein
MAKGSISGNSTKGNGGGIFLKGTFNMQGTSTITANTSGNFGGGLYISQDGGIFDKTGGTIYGSDTKDSAKRNTARIYGCAVYTANAGPQWRNASVTTKVNPKSYGFWLNEDLIADGVTTITDNEYANCSLTGTITIPDSVTSIGNGAFSGNQLTAVKIGKGVTSIGDNAFADNKLTAIVIPGNVQAIGADAFDGDALSKITLGGGITSIGKEAFDDSQVASIIIPNSVTIIGDSAFSDNNLTKIQLPSGINMPDTAFNSGRFFGWSFGEYNQNSKKGGVWTRAENSGDWVWQGAN